MNEKCFFYSDERDQCGKYVFGSAVLSQSRARMSKGRRRCSEGRGVRKIRTCGEGRDSGEMMKL